MAPEYKLYYFNSRGRAEHIRYIFAYAAVDYEDIRIDKSKWPEFKKRMPFGKVPALELPDNRIIGQSNAIGRYLAKKYNLAGQDENEALECDAYIDALADLKLAIREFRKGSSNESAKTTLMKETIPFYLDQFETRLLESGGYIVGNQVQLDPGLNKRKKRKFDNLKIQLNPPKINAETYGEIAKSGSGSWHHSRVEYILTHDIFNTREMVTWADFVFAVSLDSFEAIFGKEGLKKYPSLRALRDKVNELPGIKEWVAIRPTTEF